MCVTAALFVRQARGCERRADGSAAKPFRTRRPDINDSVMHLFTAGWAKLGHLYPAVLAKMSGDNLVRVIDVSFRRNRHAFWHLDNNVRCGNDPPFCPPKRGRVAVRVT